MNQAKWTSSSDHRPEAEAAQSPEPQAPSPALEPSLDLRDSEFMSAALEQARLGSEAGEVPVGAVVVLGERVIARAFNQPITARDPTAHAEVLALREAARVVGNYRLTDAILYVTVEPCLMCVGALVHARVRELVYGASEPKTGALVSTVNAMALNGINHRFAFRGGVLEEECRQLIQRFFRERRQSTGG